ncbi:MAG: DUF1588 domain-containing protein [Verrucomicrobiales bacterium]|nr:DUF1588 domain-containing protein [Verrucomicrobiales bacterium]
MRFIFCFLLAASTVFADERAAVETKGDTDVPDVVVEYLSNYCLDCHDGDSEKGDVNLDFTTVDWTKKENRSLWEEVLRVTNQNLMPPEKKDQPGADEKVELKSWIDRQLLANTPIGGTLPRRLTKTEYENSIRQLFNLPEFKVPAGFPKDSVVHGFNNLGEGLVLSPPLMASYTDVASKVAEELFPPARKTDPGSRTWTAGPEDLVLSFSAASIHKGALRLVSHGEDIMRSCTWPSRIEIPYSGIYRLTVDVSTFRKEAYGWLKKDDDMVLEIRARRVDASNRSKIDAFRFLQEIRVTTDSPKKYTFEAELYKGETPIFRWANAPLGHDPKTQPDHFKYRFKKNKRYFAAWRAATTVGERLRNTGSLRGKNGWDAVQRHLADPDLDLSRASMEDPLVKKLFAFLGSVSGRNNLGDTIACDYHENGPCLEIHHLKLEGPLKLIDGPGEKRRHKLRERIQAAAKPGESPEQTARRMVAYLLPRVFRRNPDAEVIDSYVAIAEEHLAEGNSPDEALNLVLRSILISPRFLYRAFTPGELDSSDLATRLAFFLTLHPPTSTTTHLAWSGELTDSAKLREEALRLLPKKWPSTFVTDFAGQWLGLNQLAEIMPDAGFRFSDEETAIARRESERFILEMLISNRPMEDFIDPNFTFSTLEFVRRNYRFTPEGFDVKKLDNTEKNRFRKLPMPRNHKHGGLLGQSAVMMATANGVDTQPVLRGAWVYENILGQPVPEPPNDVPALTPDTRGATTPRELLAAHTTDVSCAGCHRLIDPLGFALENFDPVGRWRSEWPNTGKAVDSTGVLPDGTKINGSADLKKWMVENIDIFSQCLSEKLLTYATGRVPNYAERHEIAEIIQQNKAKGNRFRDLLLDLIDSRTFRTK